MPNLISKSIIHLLTNVEYDIIRGLILIKFRKAIEQFSWDRLFKNLEVNEIVFLFNRTIKNILSNYIPHEIIICDDRDAPWINNRVKELINENNNIFQC